MKNPTIVEGGIARVFSNIRKLFTRENNTDNLITWVPESDRQLTTKYITKNGVYRASDDGYYAYSSVTVSVSTDSGVTGEGDDGEQHYVAPDPDTGELVDEVIPSSIEVTTPPTKTAYQHGETIDYTGIVVTAYKADGEIWTHDSYPNGVIPFEELSFPVTTAQADPNGEWTDNEGINAVMLTYTPHTNFTNVMDRIEEHTIYVDGRTWGTVSTGGKDLPATLKGSGPATMLATRYNGNNYYASIAGDTSVDTALYHDEDLGVRNNRKGWFGYGSTSPLSDHNVFERGTWQDVLTDFPVSTADPTEASIGDLHCTQTLPVLWARYGDGEVLETSVDIDVTSANSSEENET